MLLSEIKPSLNWEVVPLDPVGQYSLWVWYHPTNAPNTLIFSIPDALFRIPQIALLLTVRQLIAAVHLESNDVKAWTVNGQNFDAAGGLSPAFDQRVLLPFQKSDPQVQVVIWMNVRSQTIPYEDPTASSKMYFRSNIPDSTIMPVNDSTSGIMNGMSGIMSGASGISNRSAVTHLSSMKGIAQAARSNDALGPLPMGSDQLFDMIDGFWNDILRFDSQIKNARKQLEHSTTRITSMNRDLSPEERRLADVKDARDWQEARRGLRDAYSALFQLVKEVDLATIDADDRRSKLDQTYKTLISARIPFSGLESVVREFQSYHKSLKELHSSVQNGISQIGQNAERRAAGILVRIGAKSRSSGHSNKYYFD